uniref:Neuroglobin n=1 Tax=Plectus sambesii TaxID=2011161 RepID=A0A914WBY4_9BILA
MGCCNSTPSKSSISPEAACKPSGDTASNVRKSSFIQSSIASMISAVTFNFASLETTPSLDLTEEQKAILQEHWKKTLLAQRPDYFHKVMLISIQQSPKMNEVIACQMYCVRDLTQWPKLDRMSKGVRDFIDRQITVNDLDSAILSQEARELGGVHARYAQYGFKPAFLDIWQNSALLLLEKLKFDDEKEKELFIDAWRLMISFISEFMMIGYDSSMQLVRSEKKKESSSLDKTNVTNLQDAIDDNRTDNSTNSGER